MKYSSLDMSKFEIDGADTANIVQSLVNTRANNRAERRSIMRSLGKYQNREVYYDRQIHKESENLKEKYQRKFDERIDDANKVVHDGLIDNWKKSTALAALVLKRKYNWSNGRVGTFIEKANEMHIEMSKNGEWENILDLLSEECDIELEVNE